MPIQSHVSENKDEVKLVEDQHKGCSYTQVCDLPLSLPFSFFHPQFSHNLTGLRQIQPDDVTYHHGTWCSSVGCRTSSFQRKAIIHQSLSSLQFQLMQWCIQVTQGFGIGTSLSLSSSTFFSISLIFLFFCRGSR